MHYSKQEIDNSLRDLSSLMRKRASNDPRELSRCRIFEALAPHILNSVVSEFNASTNPNFVATIHTEVMGWWIAMLVRMAAADDHERHEALIERMVQHARDYAVHVAGSVPFRRVEPEAGGHG